MIEVRRLRPEEAVYGRSSELFGKASIGQMSVELAVVMPVALVVALAVFNLCRFLELCAAFDRSSYDAVVSLGVSPAGESGTASSVEQIQSCIKHEVGDADVCDVEVSAASYGVDGGSASFSLVPQFTRYDCRLVYHPWPGSLVIGGVSIGSPFALHHERSLAVDRFRPGVVM